MRDMGKMLFSTKGHSGYFILNSYVKRIDLKKNSPDTYIVRARTIENSPKGNSDKFGGKIVMPGSGSLWYISHRPWLHGSARKIQPVIWHTVNINDTMLIAMTGTLNTTATLLRVRIVPKCTALSGMVVCYNVKALRLEIYRGGWRDEGRLGVGFIVLRREEKWWENTKDARAKTK